MVWLYEFMVGVWGSGFRVWGFKFRVQGLGLRVQGSGFRFQVSGFLVEGSGFRVLGLLGFRFWVQGFRSRVYGLGFGLWIKGFRFRVWVSEFRVQGTRLVAPLPRALPQLQLPRLLPFSSEFRGSGIQNSEFGVGVQGVQSRVQVLGSKVQNFR